METSSVSSKLTIVLTTYNRSEKLEQLVNFYLVTNVRCRIIVTDCSTDNHLVNNKLLLSKFSEHLRIEHLILPSDYCNYEAFYHGLNNVFTPYVVMSADDDFLIIKALLKSVDFLEKNLDYAACQGKQIFFTKWNNKILFGKSYMVDTSIDGSTAELRIENSMINNDRFYAPKSVYSVMRTGLTKNIYFDALSLGLDHNNTEGLVNRLLLISGKIKLLPSLYIVREHGIHNAGIISKIRYTKIINNQFNLKSFPDLDLNEKIIISDKELQHKESYKESIARIRNLCVKYILLNTNMEIQNASMLFEKWNNFFKDRNKKSTSRLYLRLSLLVNSIFFNLYPFGSVIKIKKILKG